MGGILEHGINTVRGSAAEALAKIIESDPRQSIIPSAHSAKDGTRPFHCCPFMCSPDVDRRFAIRSRLGGSAVQATL